MNKIRHMNCACLKQGIPRKETGNSLNDLAMDVLILLLLHRLSLKINVTVDIYF